VAAISKPIILSGVLTTLTVGALPSSDASRTPEEQKDLRPQSHEPPTGEFALREPHGIRTQGDERLTFSANPWNYL
jgi:hypothetical protein